MKNPEASPLILLVSLAYIIATAAFGERAPQTDAERLARGREIVNRIWYDGVGLTVVMHDNKVFAQARMPETLDKTLDAMTTGG
jgi:hypothetical protein